MKDFAFKLNYSHHLLVTPPKNNIATYKYYITRGNHGNLIRNCMRNRWWWVASDNTESPENNFIWTQAKKQELLDKIKNVGINESYEKVELSKNKYMNTDTTKTTKSTIIESDNNAISSQGESDSNISMNMCRPKKSPSRCRKKNDFKNTESFDTFKGVHERILTETE